MLKPRLTAPRAAMFGLTGSRAVICVLVLAAVLNLWLGRGVAFIGDEWAWLFGGLHTSADTIIGPYNGHLLATTWGVYDVLLVTVGWAHYWVYRAIALLLGLVVAWLVFVLARRRVGSSLAVAPAAVVALLGTGADVFLSVNIGILGATAACLGALVMLDGGTRRGDLAASVLLVIGLASFTSAVAFTAGVFVEVAWHRDRWRRLWVPLVPTVLYIVWRLHWGGGLLGAANPPGSVIDVVRQAYDAATGAISGLGGVQLASPTIKAQLPWVAPLAQALVGLGIGLLGLLLLRSRPIGGRLASLLVVGIVMSFLIAVGRGSLGDPYASRYVYQGAVVPALIITELAAGYVPLLRAHARLVVLAVTISVALNIGWLLAAGNHLRQESTTARSQLAALEIAGRTTAADFRPSSGFVLAPVTAGLYFQLVRKFGRSPAYTPVQLHRLSERDREAADGVLVRAMRLRLAAGRSPGRGGAAPIVGRLANGRVFTVGSCLVVTPTGSAADLKLTPRSPSGVVVEGARGVIAVQARRFGGRFRLIVGAINAASGPGRLATPLGAASDPWHLRLFVTDPVKICSGS